MSLYTAFTHLPLARRKSITQDIVAFSDGVLAPDRWPTLFQDLLEAGALGELPYRFTIAAQHCVDLKLCTYTGRGFQ